MKRNCVSGWSRPALLSAFILAGSLVADAQTAQLTGRITDPSGAVVPGVKIVVTNVENSSRRETVSNDEGYYTVPLLQPGNYQVTVQKEGFKPINQSGLTLEVQQVARLDFALEIGNPSYGQVTNQPNQPRVIQFALKLIY